jgi:hypothetical protein
MAGVLVYYPFKTEAWFGKSVTFTIKEKHAVSYCSENFSNQQIKSDFERVAIASTNKVYIVGHCSAGEDDLYSQKEDGEDGKEESIGFAALAKRLSDYTGQGITNVGQRMRATIKILACESGAASFEAGAYKFFGNPVPRTFLSFAQKLWDELYYRYGFRCTCQAYTKLLFWYTNKVLYSGEKKFKAAKPTIVDDPTGRFVEDFFGNLEKAQGHRIDLLATPNMKKIYFRSQSAPPRWTRPAA